MELNYISGAIESILFASGEPIERKKLAEVLEIEPDAIMAKALKKLILQKYL